MSKNRLSSSEQAAAAQLLAAERERTSAQVAALTRDFEDIVAGSEASNLDDEHDPEGATIGFERAQLTALLSQARAHLDDLDQSLARLDSGSYGTCQGCGDRIPAARLTARPTARTCVACATRSERRS